AQLVGNLLRRAVGPADGRFHRRAGGGGFDDALDGGDGLGLSGASFRSAPLFCVRGRRRHPRADAGCRLGRGGWLLHRSRTSRRCTCSRRAPVFPLRRRHTFADLSPTRTGTASAYGARCVRNTWSTSLIASKRAQPLIPFSVKLQREPGKLFFGSPEVARAKLLDTSQVCLFGNAQLSAQALREVSSRGIPICHFSYGGWFHAITTGMIHKNVELRIG